MMLTRRRSGGREVAGSLDADRRIRPEESVRKPSELGIVASLPALPLYQQPAKAHFTHAQAPNHPHALKTTTPELNCNMGDAVKSDKGSSPVRPSRSASTASASSASASASVSSSSARDPKAKGKAKGVEENEMETSAEARFFDDKPGESRELPDAEKTFTPCGVYERTFFVWVYPLISFAFHNGQLQHEE